MKCAIHARGRYLKDKARAFAAVLAAATLAAGTALAAKPAKAAETPALNDDMLNVQVQLSRAHFSPGIIDGHEGPNVRRAIAAFAQARGLKSSGELNAAVRKALNAEGADTLKTYKIKAADLAGPFAAPPPRGDIQAMAQREALFYASVKEALAERFRISETLLEKLNPRADFTKAGQTIKVPNLDGAALDSVARIEVDSKAQSLLAYGEDKELIAFFPVTIGAAASAPPDSSLDVEAVMLAPAYYYDPTNKTFGPAESPGALRIAPGPNNPFGAAWIDLSKDFCGIQGTPEPRLIGKPDSEGCIKLTNWDIAALAKAVSPGVEVDFIQSSAKMALN